MKSDACVALLEEKLSLSKESVMALLDAVVAGIVEELVQRGEISVKGLGYFKVVHIPFRKTVQGNVMRAQPPLKKIVFFTRPVVDSRALRIIEYKTGFPEKEAEKFHRVLTRHFRESLAKKQELHLEGLGAFTKVDERYIFVPDKTLQEIVNNTYQNLPAFEIDTH